MSIRTEVDAETGDYPEQGGGPCRLKMSVGYCCGVPTARAWSPR